MLSGPKREEKGRNREFRDAGYRTGSVCVWGGGLPIEKVLLNLVEDKRKEFRRSTQEERAVKTKDVPHFTYEIGKDDGGNLRARRLSQVFPDFLTGSFVP